MFIVERPVSDSDHNVSRAETADLVDMVIVDDDVELMHNMLTFLTQPTHYPDDIPVLFGQQFKNNSRYSSIEFTKLLHERGYTQLHLVSGYSFMPGEVPDYITVTRKDDIDRLTQLFG